MLTVCKGHPSGHVKIFLGQSAILKLEVGGPIIPDWGANIATQGKEIDHMKATLRDWLTSFWEITVHPSQTTFINESRKAKGKFVSVIGWLTFVAAFNDLFVYVVYKQFAPLVIVLTFIVGPIAFLLFAFWLDTIYRRAFHRQKSYYDEFLYLTVAIYVPYTIWSSLLRLTPSVGHFLWWTSFLYLVIMLTIAVKSLTKLKTWQAATTVIFSLVLGVMGLICLP